MLKSPLSFVVPDRVRPVSSLRTMIEAPETGMLSGSETRPRTADVVSCDRMESLKIAITTVTVQTMNIEFTDILFEMSRQPLCHYSTITGMTEGRIN